MRFVSMQVMIAAFALALTACTGKTPPPAIHFDDGAYRQATVQSEPPKPVDIVSVPQPLPLPGQLQPAPTHAPRVEKAAPPDRVAAANRAALQEPTTHGYINAVQVYPFSDGALYRLYAAPEQVTDITLQAGEGL